MDDIFGNLGHCCLASLLSSPLSPTETSTHNVFGIHKIFGMCIDGFLLSPKISVRQVGTNAGHNDMSLYDLEQ